MAAKRRRKAATTREEWLINAVDTLRPLFVQLASVDVPEVRVSCGFPGGGSPRKRIGECWKVAACASGVAEIFVSPVLADPIMVLATLVHEMVHAWDRGENGHKAPFARVARAMGLEGKMTATHAGEELSATLADIAAELGPYPHAEISLAVQVKKQTTRMIKVECPACGYVLRTTAKWLEVGVPTCCCGEQMEAAA